ncbi:Nif3-like dinuclear metal center hexameric protein [Adhaeribacter radiodurans]|uniref:Nif3-like dinuclear metal center hexameric protein n=1 Tax=Adhaeribacter radiodurans TaxID=2745197 RepID=A0A7L7L2X6_9BACT|nr:Nif3-like dinuclear metal center hexameric protein [Adhaeribacter radiodurans]QMU27152.1 Nif3-like dinuclear metal center hexameric protein [Adhaeribacter radiodurans]
MNLPKNNSSFLTSVTDRRAFINALTKAVGASVLLTSPFVSQAENSNYPQQSYTVKQIIDLFLKEIPEAPFDKTVDTLKSGSADTKVTGIITTMFATIEVIRKAIDLKANFIIAHEPTFYSHQDDTDWLQKDEVYQYKANLLKQHNIAVWRNHDYLHTHKPDGVMAGLIAALGWQKYVQPETQARFVLPATSFKDLVAHVKSKLNIQMVRYMGEPTQSCRKVLLLPGASGAKRHIAEIEKEKPDVVLVGEAQEWETVEYVRDAQAKGDKLSLVLLGHAVSEEPGAEWMASWLKAKVPGLKVTHVASRNPLSFM